MKKIIIFIIIGIMLLPIFINIETCDAVTATVFTGVNVYNDYNSQRKLVRQSNGTLWCTFEESNDVHVAFSLDAGVTWNDIEVWGAETSQNPSICVDSNDVVHLVFSSYKNDADDYQLEYSNSTDWTTIVQIRDEDKIHSYPSIAVDSNDNLHIVYNKGEEGTSNDDQVAYINSMNNGATWGTEQILTDEPDVDDDTWYPSIAVNSTNGIHVVFHCKDHYLGKNDILHMSSSDCGNTWTDWEADTVYQDDTFDQSYPCIAIDDNDVTHVVWVGISQNTNNQIGYSYNDSSGWKAVEWITWYATRDHVYPSISVNNNDYIHTAYEVEGVGLNHSVNDTTSWTEDIILPLGYKYPNMISTQWPVIGGLKTNRPRTGYAFTCTFQTSNITYYASADLTWSTPFDNDAPTQTNQLIWNETTHVEKSLNAIDVDLYPTSFNVTVSDAEGNKTNITILTNESGIWTVVNKTTTGLINGSYNFTNTSWIDTYNKKYWISFNVTDSTSWTNNTYHFTTVFFDINTTKVGNITLVDHTNASLGVNVNYTYNISNIGSASLTNIIMNETWFDCSCSNWKYKLISTNLSGGISNITWYNTSCYAIFNIPNISAGNVYSFYMIINITQCAANTYGFVNNSANVTCDKGVTSSANHSIQWQTVFSTTKLRVVAQYYYTDIEPNANLLFTIIGILLIVSTIFIIIFTIYTRDRDEDRW